MKHRIKVKQSFAEALTFGRPSSAESPLRTTGNRLLHRAAIKGHFNFLDLVVKAGGLLEATNNEGPGPQRVARRQRCGGLELRSEPFRTPIYAMELQVWCKSFVAQE